MRRIGQAGQAQQHERQLERPPAPVLPARPARRSSAPTLADGSASPARTSSLRTRCSAIAWLANRNASRAIPSSRSRSIARSSRSATSRARYQRLLARPGSTAPISGSLGQPLLLGIQPRPVPGRQRTQRPDQLVAGQLRAAQRGPCPAPGPAPSPARPAAPRPPGSRSWPAARPGPRRRGPRRPPRTAGRARTSRTRRCSSSRCSRSSSRSAGGARRARGRCARRRSPVPVQRGHLSRTWYSRAVSGVRAPALAVHQRHVHDPPRTAVPHGVPDHHALELRIRDQRSSDASASSGTSTGAASRDRASTRSAAGPARSHASPTDPLVPAPGRLHRTTSTSSAGTMNDSPIADAAIEPGPDRGLALRVGRRRRRAIAADTSRSTSAGSSSASTVARCRGSCCRWPRSAGASRGTSRPSRYRSAGDVPGGSSSSGPSHGPSRSRSSRYSSSARTSIRR